MSDLGRLVAGRYRLLERIGRGGMGTVWRAEDELLGRAVAVKRLHPPQPHLQDDELETLFERTRREARGAARISHPHVVVVHDVVDDEGLPAIVMEYVPSTTLGDLLKERGPVTPGEAARIGRAMIAALRAAHSAGVLHRDVKPGNVLLSDTGRVVLTDFGIAQVSGTSTLTRTGELIGSIDFLAPERLTGGTPGPEADLWALGATLFQAVEGRSPFRRDTAIETAYAIATEEAPTTAGAGPLGPVIAGLLVRDPQSRLSAAEAERMLRASAAETETARVPRESLVLPHTAPTAVVRPAASGPPHAPAGAAPTAAV
ncbi:serine/threonine-protein kinase, partial [Streptomyces sp. ME03-5709C]|nr:serine/threonine-protein kinase [Streptomyces sp. ME03-5709C]